MEPGRHCENMSVFHSASGHVGLVKPCGEANDRSHRGHQSCETSLTGESGSIVSVSASLGCKPLPP
jgi:hypothetical protein